MKKLIFKFWILNLVFSLVLYIGYRIVLSNTDTEETNMFEFILKILELILDIYVIALFLAVMIVCSFTYFLNLNDKIRNNTFFSFLTFSGIPISIVLFYFIIFNIDFQTEGFEAFKMIEQPFLIGFIYIFFTILSFIFFRRQVRKY